MIKKDGMILKTDILYKHNKKEKTKENKKWLKEITNYNNNNINGYAGNFGNALGGIRVRLNDNSKITIKSHIKNPKIING